ncbi:MAG: 16S rRNA (guanine(966)-N(2))-methyltransferase RsmD [Defluviitaleaceae bacterium]|nr:16S rRNA (guanine(966)-N(2))-methyltransferase RsmD [Defluviitaleaceae bacterium]
MRVISGKARGTTLFPPEGNAVRPTTDFTKENLFNIIQADVAGCVFLDLFAGCGGVGIEALSRGAVRAVFVDNSQKSIDLVGRNLAKTRMTANADVIKGEIPAVLTRLQGQKFDLIFLDPPYAKGLATKTLEGILSADILADDGYIIAEVAKEEDFAPCVGLEIFKTKVYSGSKLIFIGWGGE